eukprot:2134252-Rhodomonas_salina.1
MTSLWPSFERRLLRRLLWPRPRRTQRVPLLPRLKKTAQVYALREIDPEAFGHQESAVHTPRPGESPEESQEELVSGDKVGPKL